MTPLAKVGSHILYWEELRAQLDFIRLQSTDSSHYVEQEIQDWVHNKILLLECERLNLESDDFVASQIQKAKQEVLIHALEQSFLKSTNEQVSRAMIDNFYKKNPDLFLLKEEHLEVEVFRHPDLELCKTARQKVLRGEHIKDMILELDDGTIKTNLLQEYYQLLSRTEYLSLAPAYFKNRKLSVGEVSDVYYYQGVPTFIRIAAIKSEGTIAPVTAVEPQIRHWLKTKSENKNLSAFKKALYLKAESNNQIEFYYKD